jgi:hypothetical protein
MNKIRINICIEFIFLTLVVLALYSCKNSPDIEIGKQEETEKISNEEAVKIANNFCNKLNLTCKGEPSIRDHIAGLNHMLIRDYFSIHYPEIPVWDPHKKNFVLVVYNGTPGRVDYISFEIRNKSKSVEGYQNFPIYNHYEQKYVHEGRSKSGSPYTYRDWPEVMSEEKAMKIFNSIAKKIGIPSDMFFERIEKHKRAGVWNAIWLRKKNGYQYEGDAISMSIIGATGEFIGYTKTYFGQPSATDVKINKDQALELGWKNLKKNISWRLRKRVKEIYDANAKLLILRQNYNKNKYKTSKLAWVIKYEFTGGIKRDYKIKDKYEWTEEENAAYTNWLRKMRFTWREMGSPLSNYEIRIDAATGEIIYDSFSEMPLYDKLLKFFKIL